MSETRLSVKAAQPEVQTQPAADPGTSDIQVLTDLELALAGGGDEITPWP